MADDQDRYDGQDDSEYHFSDEQMNYEMDDIAAHEEVTKSAEQAKVPPAEAKKVNSRRYMISIGVFVVLIFMVYKLMLPPTTTPPGEISQVVSPPMVAKPPVREVKASLPPSPATAPAPMQGMQPNQVQPQTMQQSAVSSMTPPAPISQPQARPMMPTATPTQTPMVTAPPSVLVTTPSSTDMQAIMRKLDTLTEQNTKMSYQVSTEYPQKFASYEEQNAALQSKVQDLTSRIAALEGDLSQIMQAVRGNGPPPPRQVGSSMPTASPPVPSEGQVFQQPMQEPTSPAPLSRPEPKMSYSVQAIIPGRAWLKSETGDTITIAEGDILKDLGRVVKIDPYDGVVEVDTGAKIISLSYGGNAE